MQELQETAFRTFGGRQRSPVPPTLNHGALNDWYGWEVLDVLFNIAGRSPLIGNRKSTVSSHRFVTLHTLGISFALAVWSGCDFLERATWIDIAPNGLFKERLPLVERRVL